MKPLETLGETLDSQGIPCRLCRRGGEYYFYRAGILVASSGERRIDSAHGEIACRVLAGKRQPRLVISGLGLGALAESCLRLLPPRAQVTICECCPELVRWLRESAPDEAAVSVLADPRVSLVEAPLLSMLPGLRGEGCDAILAGEADRPFPFAEMGAALREGGRITLRLEAELGAKEARVLERLGFRLRNHVVYAGAKPRRGQAAVVVDAALPWVAPVPGNKRRGR